MKPVQLRGAVFAKLNVSAITSLLSAEYGAIPAVFHDTALQAQDSGAGDYFPYVSFSVVSDTGLNDKGVSGTNALVQVDVWSRLGTTQCETLAQAVYDQLHRSALSVDGHIITECEAIDFTLDPDGITRRGLLRFRVLALE